MASVFKFQTDFCYDFVAQRFISSRAHPNGIFASARKSRVGCKWKKMFCITVWIKETFNVKIVLNMLRINIENTTRPILH